ncbi:MAG TPA: hypothetical protein VF329_14335 [Gammaproteobacteria bacterium]
MDAEHRPKQLAPGTAGLAEAEDPADGSAADEATLSFDGRLEVSADEDTGADPYNRTGRFERLVR